MTNHTQRVIERWDRDRNPLWLTAADVDALIEDLYTLAKESSENEADANQLRQELQRVCKMNESLSPVRNVREAIGGMKL